MSKFKKIPKFENEADEREFWQSHDSSDYVDWSQAKLAKFPNLKSSTEKISLRLPESLLFELKIMANKYDVPYQSLIKILLVQQLNKTTDLMIQEKENKPMKKQLLLAFYSMFRNLLQVDQFEQDLKRELEMREKGMLLQQIRKEVEMLSEDEFAQRLGISTSELTQIESGQSIFSKKIAKKIEKEFGIEHHYFLD